MKIGTLQNQKVLTLFKYQLQVEDHHQSVGEY